MSADIDEHLKRADDQSLGVAMPRFFTAADLDDVELPPLTYVVPGIIVEGLTLLAGKPKARKSWFCLDLGLAVAWGGSALGGRQCPEGDVLYAALEDSPRRLQERMRLMSPDHAKPHRLTFATKLPPLGGGCLKSLEGWLGTVSDPKLIMLDTLGRLRDDGASQNNQYQADYRLLAELQQWALGKNLAVMLVHHTRKLETDDPFDQVSGTQGLAGAADTVLILKKDGTGSTLHGRGRDIEEFAHALDFDTVHCRWNILGDSAEVRRSTERQQILEVLAASPEPIGPTEIAVDAEMKNDNVRGLLRKMVAAGEVEQIGRGRYQIPGRSRPNAAECDRRNRQSDHQKVAVPSEDRHAGDGGHIDHTITSSGQNDPKALNLHDSPNGANVTGNVIGTSGDHLSQGESDRVIDVTGGAGS